MRQSRAENFAPGDVRAVHHAIVAHEDEPGEKVLDACAGRGNKTALFAELVGPNGAVDAADQHQQKLARLRESLSQWGLAVHATFAVDWTVGAGDVPADYDRVLVDAPCSGLGALRRRPESRWRRSPDDVTRLVGLQRALLGAALDATRPGGVVVYATCSPVVAETADVVRAVLGVRGDAALEDAGPLLP